MVQQQLVEQLQLQLHLHEQVTHCQDGQQHLMAPQFLSLIHMDRLQISLYMQFGARIL